uniref:Uncharacterized protein n=1 Tax=Rhizophora mucronata TaxID=61149 RepID=A0A2P2P559_RHIMU
MSKTCKEAIEKKILKKSPH